MDTFNTVLKDAVRELERSHIDQYELFCSRKTATKIEVKGGEVDTLSRAEDVGLAIRLIDERRMGFSFTTSLDPSAIKRAVQSARQVAVVMPEDPFFAFQSFGARVYPAVDTYDQAGLKLKIEAKIDLAKKLESEAKKADSRIKAVRTAGISETEYETHMLDSGGEHIHHRSTLYSATISCKAEENGDAQMGYDFGFSNYFDNLDVSPISVEAAKNATSLLNGKLAPTFKCSAVIKNSEVASLIGFLSASFSAEEIDKGRSMLARRQGERVFSERVTLIDDGLLPGGLMTSPFDGEGVPSTRTVLVDGGFVAGSLYDLYYAQKTGKESTGSAMRGIKSPPSISTSNFYMEKGKKNLTQLTHGITRGIYITNLMGVHTANPVTGDFSLGASGIMIENGELTHPVRGFAVAGNILELLKGVTEVGQDLRFFGGVGAPSVRVREISVGGA